MHSALLVIRNFFSQQKVFYSEPGQQNNSNTTDSPGCGKIVGLLWNGAVPGNTVWQFLIILNVELSCNSMSSDILYIREKKNIYTKAYKQLIKIRGITHNTNYPSAHE